MTNVLETYRRRRDLSFAELARRCGEHRATVLRHCRGLRPIGAESVLRYHVRLGIPLEALRPDLYVRPEA
jgi:transcriptional regulator with XRE-family HTH domain